MSMAALLTGTKHFSTPGVDEAVAARFLELQNTPAFVAKKGDTCYDGNRCKPENLGWRFMQNCRQFRPTISEIGFGRWDTEIAETYHDAARAEHWYRFEKEW